MTTTTHAVPAVAESTQPDGGGVPSRWIGLGLVVMLGAFSAFMVLVSIHRAPQLSPYDEWTHADYAYRIAHGTIPERGTVIAPEILKEWTCHGLPNFLHASLPACGAQNSIPVSKFPNGGQDYNFGHPLVYYAVTGIIARAAVAVGPEHDFIVAARAVGLLWLWAGMALLYLAVRRLGASWLFAGLSAAAVVPIPWVLGAASSVTNDATGVFCGALTLLVIVRVWKQQRGGWLIPGVATVIVAGCKEINAVALLVFAGVMVLAVVVDALRHDFSRVRRYLVPAISIAVGFVVVYKGWSVYQSGRGPSNWVNPVSGISGSKVTGSVVRALTSTAFSDFDPLRGYYLPASLQSQPYTEFCQLVSALLIAAPIAAMVISVRRSALWVVGVTLFLSLIAYPIAVEVQIYTSQHHLYFPIVNTRYGFPLIPVAIASLALVAHRRGARWIAAGGTGIFALIASLSVVGVG